MLYILPIRRFLLPAIVLLALVVLYRSRFHVTVPSFVFHQPPPPPNGIHVPIAEVKSNSLPFNTSRSPSSPNQYLSDYSKIVSHKAANGSLKSSIWDHPISNPRLDVLWKCPTAPNKYTTHIRLPNIIQNISQISPNPAGRENRVFWNPTIIALPYWSENQYLVVSRIVTAGLHQENVLCEANICYTGSAKNAHKGEKPCTLDDLKHVGPAGGMRCVSPPISLSVPPTPAKSCPGKLVFYTDIPGFHDPRIFWSGKGEPLMMVNTQSRYACFGLWIIDLRSLYFPLANLLTSSPRFPSLGPLKSYSSLTELTRNPDSTRSTMEKNWMFFYPTTGETFLHYDVPDPRKPERGRTFAKVLGGGLTTTNLTDPFELPCIRDVPINDPDMHKQNGTWHQATNSLRLVLCNRSDKSCKPTADNSVFFAIVHRKHSNFLKLPLRYERYFIIWSAAPPFNMLGISQHPILMANETASGWEMSENWDDDQENAKLVAQNKLHHGLNSTEPHGGKGYWAYFTYTVSMAWAWNGEAKTEPEEMNVGYWDDEVVLGIGVDDAGQGFSRVKAGELVQCLKACPGRRTGGRQR